MRITEKLIAVILVIAVMLPMSIVASGIDTGIAMASMHELESDEFYIVDDSIKDSYGNSYSSNILKFVTGYEAFVTYDLNGNYDTFRGSIVCSDRTNGDAVMQVGIYADGVKVYELKNYTKQMPAQPFTIDVSGVGELSIKTTKTEGSTSSSDVFFVKSFFTKADRASIYPDRTEFTDLVIIDSNHCNVSDRLFVDSFGDIHNGSICIYTEWHKEGYVLFNLDKRFLSLSGSIATSSMTRNDRAMDVKFYLDDKLVYEKSNITRSSSAIEFNIDVTDGRVLKIVATGHNDSYGSYVYITDGIFKVHEHTVSDWVVQSEATCTANGKEVLICEECGEVVASADIQAKGHVADTKWTVVTEPTCTEHGKQIQKCTVCGEAANTQTIEPTGHTPNGVWEYSDDGSCNKVQKCTVCGDVAVRQTDEEAEHIPGGEWVVTVEASCYATGVQVQYCEKCGKTVLEERIPVTEHEYGKWHTIHGSVWNNPIVKNRTCSICGDIEQVVSNSTAWVKPVVIALIIIVFVFAFLLFYVISIYQLPLEAATFKKIFTKKALLNIINRRGIDDDN